MDALPDEELVASLEAVRGRGRGDSPVRAMWRADHVEVVRLLLDRGADVEARDGKRRTPRDVAQKAKHTEVASLLLAKEKP